MNNKSKCFKEQEKVKILNEKFILLSIQIQRTPPKPIKHMGVVVRMKEETLTVTMDYVGFGDTTKITKEQLLDKVKSLLGCEL